MTLPPVSRLDIHTLGSLMVALDGIPVDIRSSKALALLVYLAETDRPHHRSALAGLLWPDHPESAARNNLRQALTALRKAIGEHITTSGDRVHLAGEVAIDTRPITAEGYRGPFLEDWLPPPPITSPTALRSPPCKGWTTPAVCTTRWRRQPGSPWPMTTPPNWPAGSPVAGS
ncbi:MAG: hypothetical protein ACFCVC_03820 [Acidimicrobiia bacterium]